MKNNQVVTETAKLKAVGPYSLARKAGGLVFYSGQLGVGTDKQLVPGGTMAEFNQIAANLKELLAASGRSFADIVKVVVYITAMSEYAELNQTYAQIFSEPYPVRTTVQVAALPLGAHIEIEITA
jgi:2-iminobutanoate/2-iminopropanoate deaminase